MNIAVFTNDNHLWLLNGFRYLFNKYWSSEQEISVVGYNEPDKWMNSNFIFNSIADENYPVDRWTTGIKEFLESVSWEYFIMFLEDYWLIEDVNLRVVQLLWKYIQECNDYILRIDLTADRAACEIKSTYGFVDSIELIQTPPYSAYQMSFQAAIWNKHLLLEVLSDYEDPWTAEIIGSKRLAKRPDLKVLGTLVHPVKYKPVYRSKRGYIDISKLSEQDQRVIIENGWMKWD